MALSDKTAALDYSVERGAQKLKRIIRLRGQPLPAQWNYEFGFQAAPVKQLPREAITGTVTLDTKRIGLPTAGVLSWPDKKPVTQNVVKSNSRCRDWIIGCS